MKVRVVLSVDVDPKDWRAEYSEPSLTAAEVAEMVRGSIADAARTPGVVAPEGLIKDVTVKREGRLA